MKRKSYALVLVLILLVVALSLPQTRNLFDARPILSTILYPFQFAVNATIGGIGTGISSIIELRKAASKNIRLKQELETAKTQLKLMEELKQENSRLKNALDFRYQNEYGFKLLPAKIIGKGPAPYFSLFTINQGRSSGIREDLAVITESGLVGKIIEVSPLSAKVMLVIHPENSVAAVNQRSRDFGVAQGVLPNKLNLKYVDAKGDVQAGDAIVTCSLSNFYPPGIPIGQVISASRKESDLFYQIELKPAVDFSKVEEVFVILK